MLLEILVGGTMGSEARLTFYLWCPSWRSPGQVSSKQMCYLETASWGLCWSPARPYWLVLHLPVFDMVTCG